MQSEQRARANWRAGLAEQLPVRPPGAEDTIAGVEPQIVCEPQVEDQVAAVLELASEEGLAVVPRGAGTHQSVGCPPERADIVLDLRRMNRITRYDPEDLTVSVQAGCSLESLQQHLVNQFVPIDPPGTGHATIGGLVAVNECGPLQFGFGTWRDVLIGARVATPSGDLARAGGQVVKNVAGYELCKLHTGALGTLGVLVHLDLKVRPQPPARALVRLHLDDWNAVEPVLAGLMRPGLEPAILEAANAETARVVSPVPRSETAVLLYVGFLGSAESVEWQASRVQSLAIAQQGVAACEPLPWDTAYPALRDAPAELLRRHSGAVAGRATLLSSEVARFGARATSIARRAGLRIALSAHAGSGVVRFALDHPAREPLDGPGHLPEVLKTLGALLDVASATPALPGDEPSATGDIAALARLGRGNLVVEQAPDAVKRRCRAWGNEPPGTALMQRLRATFDPERTLNPGRLEGCGESSQEPKS